MSIENIIKSIVDRIRRLESIQEGNGFVPYLFPSLHGTNALTSHGNHIVRPVGSGEMAMIEITMPRKVDSLSEAVLIYIPTTTGTWDYTITSKGGYCGEDESAETDSMTADGLAVTDDELECLDISAVLTPYTVGDTVGLIVTCDALDTTSAINIIGIRLR